MYIQFSKVQSAGMNRLILMKVTEVNNNYTTNGKCGDQNWRNTSFESLFSS